MVEDDGASKYSRADGLTIIMQTIVLLSTVGLIIETSEEIIDR
jgi:hypothetical protein